MIVEVAEAFSARTVIAAVLVKLGILASGLEGVVSCDAN